MKHEPTIYTIGSGKPIVGIVGVTHGNESGYAIIKRLTKTITLKKGTVQFILANPYALAKKVRFIDADLNRIFPGKPDGNIEEQLADQLLSIGKHCDYLLDLHSCSMESEAFCIVRSDTGVQFNLAKMTGLKNIVIYPRKTQKGSSLIDHVFCGIGLELGLHNKEKTIQYGYDAVLNVLASLKMIDDKRTKRTIEQAIFHVTKQYYRIKTFIPETDITNFSLVKKHEVLGKNLKGTRYAKEAFYPIMFNQKSYSRILCWVGKKIS